MARPRLRRRTAAGALVLVLVGSACGSSGGKIRPVDAAAQPNTGSTATPPLGRGAIAEVLPAGLAITNEVPIPSTTNPALVVRVAGEDGIATWTTLRSLVPRTGRYPVIVGGPEGREAGDGLAAAVEAFDFAEGDEAAVAAALAVADGLDVESWRRARATSLGIDPADLEVTMPLPSGFGANDTFTAASDIVSGEPLEYVDILLLPTATSWQAPAYLLWGGWNDVPMPGELAAVLHEWESKYGAEVVAMTRDVIELRVADPPTDDRAAADIAAQQCVVAPDLIWQGFESTTALAAALADSHVWFFWWD